MAGEPDGRGPISTIALRSAKARIPSNIGAAAAGACGCAADTHAASTPTNRATSISKVQTLRFPDFQISKSLPLVVRHVIARAGAEIDLARAGDLLVGIVEHLFPLRDPPGGARDREQHREHLDREPHGLIDQAGIEVDVRIELARDEVFVL